MVFSSVIFILLFLPVVFVLNLAAGKKYSNAFLLLASLVFYAWGEPVYILLMVLSIILNWGIGLIISKTEGFRKRSAMALGVISDLGILGYFKYSGFLVTTVNRIVGKQLFHVREIALPIGISFFTFQAISYIIDVYRGNTKASSKIVNVALYISFFPQLIAGPIVKYRDINKQIESRTIRWKTVSDGFKRFIYGLGKKVLLANVLGLYVDTVYGYKLSGIDAAAAWIAALAYTLQIYYDFSGYSDMAIGLGKMFGFSIPENFHYPYLSDSISEFWRRWHISLGTWFREYVYIPLGGNRKGKVRTYLNLAIVFFLTGLWHGAGFSYIVWGLYHGFFVIIERLGFKRILEKLRILPVLYTSLVATLGWVLFRADSLSKAFHLFERMLLPWRYSNSSVSFWNYMDHKTIWAFVFGVIGIGFLSFLPERIRRRWSGSVIEALFCTGVFFLSLAAIAGDTYNPFIYFQF